LKHILEFSNEHIRRITVSNLPARQSLSVFLGELYDKNPLSPSSHLLRQPPTTKDEIRNLSTSKIDEYVFISPWK